MNAKSIMHKYGSLAGRAALVAGVLFASVSTVWALSPDTTPKTVNIGEEFITELRILSYVLVLIAILVANILLLLWVKDPSKLTLKYILGHFAGKDSVDKEMQHEYDGIRELDNPMPAWLSYLFIGTIFFAVVYLFHYHFLGTGPSSREEYEYEMATAAEQFKDVELPEDALIQITDAGRLTAAAGIFKENCATCHGEKLEGLTGPNLTDKYWLHGATVKDIYAVITNGVPGKTMISWKGRFSSNDRLNLASYILSLQGSNPPNGKAPEGTAADAAPAVSVPDSAGTDTASVDSVTK